MLTTSLKWLCFRTFQSCAVLRWVRSCNRGFSAISVPSLAGESAKPLRRSGAESKRNMKGGWRVGSLLDLCDQRARRMRAGIATAVLPPSIFPNPSIYLTFLASFRNSPFEVALFSRSRRLALREQNPSAEDPHRPITIHARSHRMNRAGPLPPNHGGRTSQESPL